MVTTCFLVRHGEIQANVERLWHGSTDSDLTPEGQKQISQLGQHYSDKNHSISAIYTSPLKRTIKTAQAISQARGAQVEPIAELVEYGIGEWEGLSYETIATQHGFFDSIAANQDFKPRGGESVNQVAERVLGAFYSLVDKHRGEQIMLVGHGAAFAILMAELLDGASYPFHDHHMSNTGVSRLEVSAENHVSRPVFDNTEHLI